MNYKVVAILVGIVLSSCHHNSNQNATSIYKRLSHSEVPMNLPLTFRSDLHDSNELIHRGVLSPDLKDYYFTVSDKDFTNFTIKSIERIGDKWTAPKVAFFNSEDDDHGMSFSPDGKTIYFSSTRKVDREGVEDTWHLWRTSIQGERWSKPTFIDIPNLQGKLLSHPTVTNSGRLYFHASDLDYSNMHLYYSDPINGKFQHAKPVFPEHRNLINTCTPFISPSGDFIIYAEIQESLQLMIAYKDDKGNWGKGRPLNQSINTNGQGNPFVTPDNKYLLFATGSHLLEDWNLKWVRMEDIEK